MKTSTLIRLSIVVAGACTALGSAARADAGDEHGPIAITSRVCPDYHRERLPDGRFKPETYVVGKGGFFGTTTRDDSVDRLTFPALVRTIAAPLGKQGYVPVADKQSAQLLVLVYWGATSDLTHTLSSLPRSSSRGRGGAGVNLNFNPARMNIDAKTIARLGYEDWWDSVKRFQGTVFHLRADDLIAEIERTRYLVVLEAYDYSLLHAHKQAKLVWETRFSIDAYQHEFDRDLPQMAAQAAAFFGQDSHGVRHILPEGHVEVGPLRSMNP